MKYTVQAASRATGVGPARLRTWERRYGVPRPQRSATGRRLYEEDDLAVIRRMASLVDAGVPAAQAAEAALSEVESGSVIEMPVAPQPVVDALAVAIADAAERYDEPALVESIRRAVSHSGWRTAIGEVFFPALRIIGDRWQRGEMTLASEHFASAIVKREMLAAVAALPLPSEAGPVAVLACPEDERHDLGATALWLLLRDAGQRVIFLGADVPTADLVGAVRRTEATLVSLSATSPAALPMMGLAARALVAGRVLGRIFVGGPALDDFVAAREIPGIRLPAGIGEAADTLIEALSGSSGSEILSEDTPLEFPVERPEVD